MVGSGERQVVDENLLTTASVSVVALGSVGSRQDTGGNPTSGIAPQNGSSTSHSPRNPLQHQPPRSFTVNVLSFLTDGRSGSPLVLDKATSSNRSRLVNLSNAGSDTNTANVRALRLMRPSKEGGAAYGDAFKVDEREARHIIENIFWKHQQRTGERSFNITAHAWYAS